VKIRLNKVKYTRGDYFEEEEIKEIIEAVNKTEKYRINQLRLKLIILLCYVS
jgi:integrase